MGYFPAFIKLDDKKILLVGGGNIALEKLEKLIIFTKDIVIVSLDFSNEMLALIKKENLLHEKRSYEVWYIKDFSIVVIDFDDIPLQ
jgi:precorrin-2 dehydrogenase/sirohydrochlorin ferrochelatase